MHKLIILAAVASALAITTANGAPPTPALRTLAAESNLVLQMHGCHKLCRRGPYDNPARHRHRFSDCAPTHFPCLLDWGCVLPQDPVFYKRRR
jgi:hypothetical protein